MRKFCARWWVADPLARWRAEMAAHGYNPQGRDPQAYSDGFALGLALQLIRTATHADVREALQWDWVMKGPQ